jgi:tetratricopeptide (TPR) repeat protein
METMLLSRFEPKAIADLSASMLGAAGSEPQVLSLLQDETEGNVFFLVETVRALAEEAGGLQSVGSSTLPQSVFAGGVQRIIQRRLARVKETYRPLLQLAAVAGRELELDLLHTAMPETNLETWLTACANVAVLEVQDEQWRFAHDKLRKALIDELGADKSQELHDQVGHAIESTYPDNLALHSGRLAWHYAQADKPDKERVYARLAGEQAAAQFSNDEALRFFDQALERTPKDDIPSQVELLLAQEAIYKLQGKSKDREANLDALHASIGQLEDSSQQAQIILRRAHYFYDCGDYPKAIKTAQKALELASATEQPKIAVQTYNLLASSLWKHNDLDQAELYANTGLNLAREIQDRINEAQLLGNRGMIAFDKRKLSSAQASFEQSLVIAQENENTYYIQALSLNNLGMVAGYQGDFQAALHYYEKALKIAREIGSRKLEAINLGNLGWISGLLGEHDKAITYTQDNIIIAQEISNPYNETYGLINLSAYAGITGDQETAHQSAKEALLLARQIGDRSAEAWALTNLGHSHLAARLLSKAADAYQEAFDIRQELKQPLLATEPAAGLARVYLEQADTESAQQSIQAILPFTQKENGLDGTDDPIKVYLACYLVLKLENKTDADIVLEKAYQLLQNRAANIENPDTQYSFLNNIPHHREILIAWQEIQKEKQSKG